MNNTEKAEKVYECISDIMTDDEKNFKNLYIEKIRDAIDWIETEENQSTEWQEWHNKEGHKMAMKDSEDWSLAEKYKKEHPDYSKDQILISEVWRDKDDILCVRYISNFGRKLDWFHYVSKNSEVTWW